MDNKGNNSDKRKIKQVYLSEDGNEETAVTSDIAGKGDNDEKASAREDKIPAGGHVKEEKHGHIVRNVAIAVAMVFSLILAMSVGVGLALWDSNRTIGDLRTALFTKDVAAATRPDSEQAGDEPESVASAVQNESEDLPRDDTSKEDPEDADEMDEVPGDEDDYGLTISADDEGLEGLSKAGEEDEIVKEEDMEDPEELSDPMEDYPLPFTKVDESYFTDALFIGDSRLQGFGFWSGLPATYYCATGFHVYKYETANVVQTENGKVPIFEAMPYDAFTKIYIKVGLNELGYGTEKNFEETYAQLIAKLREYEPRAIIFVHAILPVTAEKSATDSAHNNPNIVKRNEALKEFAKEQKAYFLDAGPVLSDGNGNLRPEMTSDGIHLKPEYMKIWREYLCEHGIVQKQEEN